MLKYIRPVIYLSLALTVLFSTSQAEARGILIQQGSTLQLFSQDGSQQILETIPQVPSEIPVVNSQQEIAIAPTLFKGKYTAYQSAEITISSDLQGQDIKVENDLRPLLNTNLRQISPVFEITAPNEQLLVISTKYTQSVDGHYSLYRFDFSSSNWIPLPSYNDLDEKRVIANFLPKEKTTKVAILGDSRALDGKASWYDQSKYRSFGYKGGMFAAHRTYPKGTKLRVARLKTGTSVIVTVNDWGPEEWTGRIIDLEKQAFQAIATTGAGEVYVSVEKIQ